jgi:hypothetical protein
MVHRGSNRMTSANLSNALLDLSPAVLSRNSVAGLGSWEVRASKLVKVNSEGDCWSLISLGNSRGNKNVELQFGDPTNRLFEFLVNSFQQTYVTLFKMNLRKRCDLLNFNFTLIQ